MNHSDWLVSALLLNWNGADATCRCLKSLSEQTYPPDWLEVIVVDNGSGENLTALQTTLERYGKARGWRKARMVRLPSNVGIPAGYNAGLQQASPEADAFLRLDNDTVLEKRFIERTVQTMQRFPSLAVLGGPQVRGDGTGIQLPYAIRWRKAGFFRPLSMDDADDPIDCDTLQGCALLIRKEALHGMRAAFDPGLLVLHDETDLLIRLKKAGWRVGCLTSARCFHQGNVSTGRIPRFFRYIDARNRALLMRRYAPFPDRIQSHWLILRSLLRSLIDADFFSARGFMDGLVGDCWSPRATLALPQRPEGGTG